jgi:NADH:ubiquinone oxidoreductase subunit C
MSEKIPDPAPTAPVPAAAPAKPPPPAPDPKALALRDEVQPILGAAAKFELAGKLPSFRVAAGEIPQACRKMKQAGFDYLVFVTAVDFPAEKRIELVYAIGNYRDAKVVAIVADVNREQPVMESVAGVWDAADWHEREVFDLFGVRFTNHPDPRRILLDDTWEGFPLRKDYTDRTHDVVKRPY